MITATAWGLINEWDEREKEDEVCESECTEPEQELTA